MSVAEKVEGIERLNKALNTFAHRLENVQPILEEVAGQAYYPIRQEQFDSEFDGRLKPLSPKYTKRKRELYGDKPMLQATGALMRSVTKRRAAGNVHVGVGDDTLLLGTQYSTAFYVNQDRPFFEQFSERDVERLYEAAHNSWEYRTSAAGF